MSTRAFVPIDAIVDEYILQTDDDDYGATSDRFKVRQLAVGAWRDLGFDVLGKSVMKAIVLPINQNTSSVTLPNDYIDYVRIGMLNDNCEFVTFRENQNMNWNSVNLLDNLNAKLLDNDGIELTAFNTCVPKNSYNRTTYPYNQFTTYRYSRNKGGIYGLSGGQNGNGEYLVDVNNNRILVNTGINQDEIVLEYIADETKSSNPNISVFAVDAVKAYIYKNLVERKRNVPIGEKQLAKKTYAIEKGKVSARTSAKTMAEWMSSIASRTMSAPRNPSRVYH